jgi:hypothetical protein
MIWAHLLRNFDLELVSPFPEKDGNAAVVGIKGRGVGEVQAPQAHCQLLRRCHACPVCTAFALHGLCTRLHWCGLWCASRACVSCPCVLLYYLFC